LSFVLEKGAHGGPGRDECSAFWLAPVDAPIPRDAQAIRAADLWSSGLELLGRKPPKRDAFVRRANDALRIMTYNVHACIGMDGKLSPSRIARVIRQADADVVALQELDVRRSRTGQVDQARQLAELLEMNFHFFPTIQSAGEEYGDAVLSRLPLRLIHAAQLPGDPKRPSAEPRGAIWVSVDVDGAPVHVVNTHLGLGAQERLIQVQALLGEEWLANAECMGPVVLCGDLNLLPGARPYRLLKNQLRDAQGEGSRRRKRGTWPSHLPWARLDHLFVRGDLWVSRSSVLRTGLTRVASDHLPLVVELQCKRPT
jgi:endonuclease/exonuclease/phosphatase family metal-dependent hydrolase